MRATGGNALLVSVAVLTAWTVGCCIFFGPGTRGVFGPEIPRRVFLWNHARVMVSFSRATVFEVGPEHQSRVVFEGATDEIEWALIRGERVLAAETTLHHAVRGVWAPSIRVQTRGAARAVQFPMHRINETWELPMPADPELLLVQHPSLRGVPREVRRVSPWILADGIGVGLCLWVGWCGVGACGGLLRQVRSRRNRARLERHQCVYCKYDLSGLRVGVCPECGSIPPPTIGP